VNDVRRRRQLHQVQIHGLRRGLPCGLHPDECIDCGVCEPECPVEAIKPDTEPGLENFLKVNADFAKIWPNITAKKDPPPDAKEWEDVPNKFEAQFSPNPGTGD
jgi:ferredoxin